LRGYVSLSRGQGVHCVQQSSLDSPLSRSQESSADGKAATERRLQLKPTAVSYSPNGRFMAVLTPGAVHLWSSHPLARLSTHRRSGKSLLEYGENLLVSWSELPTPPHCDTPSPSQSCATPAGPVSPGVFSRANPNPRRHSPDPTHTLFLGQVRATACWSSRQGWAISCSCSSRRRPSPTRSSWPARRLPSSLRRTSPRSSRRRYP